MPRFWNGKLVVDQIKIQALQPPYKALGYAANRPFDRE